MATNGIFYKPRNRHDRRLCHGNASEFGCASADEKTSVEVIVPRPERSPPKTTKDHGVCTPWAFLRLRVLGDRPGGAASGQPLGDVPRPISGLLTVG
jgi:hypothetical protein